MSALRGVLARCRDDPVLFATRVLGLELDPWQIEFLTAVQRNSKTTVRSGHGVGKSLSLAVLCMWFLCTRSPAKIVVTAVKADQMEDILWSELEMMKKRLPEALRDIIELQATKFYVFGLERENFGVARTARIETPEALQGHHSKNLLLLCEEASGIPDIIFEVGEGTMSTVNAKTVLIGNMTRATGFFWKTHFDPVESPSWYRIHVDARKVRWVDRKWCDDMRSRYGEDSDRYRVRVLGEPPSSGNDVFISRQLLELSASRWEGLDDDDGYRPVWGLDVAEQGNDRCAIAKRRGFKMMGPVEWWYGRDTMATVGRVLKAYKDSQKTPLLMPKHIYVDAIGIGVAIADRLDELIGGGVVVKVKVSESATEKEEFTRLRDELAHRASEWLTDGGAIHPDDPELVNDSCRLTFDYPLGKLKLQSKRDLRAKGEPSCDLFDSWMLTFAGGVDVLDEELVIPQKYRVNYQHTHEGSWMSA